MSELYGRDWSIEVIPKSGPARSFVGFRLRADVSFGGMSTEAVAEVANPPEELVGLLRAPGSLVHILAGYVDNGGAVQVIRGGVLPRSVQYTSQPPTPTVGFHVAGSRAELTATTLGAHLSGPVAASEVIERIRKELGIAKDVVRVGEDVTYARGYAISGGAAPLLSSLCEDTRSEWAITDGRLRVWPAGEAARKSIDVWTSSSGLLDVTGPADDKLVRASALLRGHIRRGDTVRIESDTWTGEIVVVEGRHTIDTHGAWSTSIVGRPHAG